MTLPILICDDSNMARKQVARSLPEGWDVTIRFAKNGQEALDVIRAGDADMMFLDLTMPVLDGYGVLETVREEDLNCMIIVISGDIQPEAHERVKALGAIDFIKKPVDTAKLHSVLQTYGLIA